MPFRALGAVYHLQDIHSGLGGSRRGTAAPRDAAAGRDSAEPQAGGVAWVKTSRAGFGSAGWD